MKTRTTSKPKLAQLFTSKKYIHPDTTWVDDFVEQNRQKNAKKTYKKT